MWAKANRLLATTAVLCAVLSLGGCFDDGDDGGSTPQSYTVGGTLSGLGSGLSVTLLNNGANSLTRTANGSFTFSTTVRSGNAYAVTVGTQPVGQACTVGNGSGTMGNAAVTNVTVSCVDLPRYTIGGTISGLGGGLAVTLLNNGGDALVGNANGAFTFTTGLFSGASYAVTVDTQPAGQTCVVSNGSGTVAGANVTNVGVTCSTNPINTYSVGGTVSGLGSGLSVTLLNNGGNALTRSSNGAFAFSSVLPAGSAYLVTVGTQPTGQTCIVSNGGGVIGSANVTNVGITCSTSTYSVGGTLSGLGTGLSVTLQNNAGNDLALSANGPFTFTTKLATGAIYDVTVKTHPAGQTCAVGSAAGTIASADITNVSVTCSAGPRWAWQGGSKLVGPAGVYGTKGVPSTTNAPGGRNWNGSWVDTKGSFWIFGGQGYDAYHSSSALNDLWRYSPSTKSWTWMSGSNTINALGFYGTKGTPDPANVPGAREFMATWVADNGDLWLFGGYGFDAFGNLGYLNDVWRYQPSSNQWTWMGGSNMVDAAGIYGTQGVEAATNHPGARFGPVAFQYGSGNLYMFGGYGVDANGVALGYLNDLWMYNPTNGRWTWISGSNTYGATGVYGTKGVAAVGNVPGARNFMTMVPDMTGLWLFGGLTVDGTNTPIALNDLWRYDIPTNRWTWVSGANVPNSWGVYGTKGTPAASNVPGARGGMLGWTDGPYLYVFGGAGYDSVGNGNTDLNDLWRFDPQSGRWTWLGGSNLAGAKGIYGTLGSPSASNWPGARDSGTVFYDEFFTGHAWLFGGAGYDSTGVYDSYGLNDLWELTLE